jgi:hypothetical protein
VHCTLRGTSTAWDCITSQCKMTPRGLPLSCSCSLFAAILVLVNFNAPLLDKIIALSHKSLLIELYNNNFRLGRCLRVLIFHLRFPFYVWRHIISLASCPLASALIKSLRVKYTSALLHISLARLFFFACIPCLILFLFILVALLTWNCRWRVVAITPISRHW